MSSHRAFFLWYFQLGVGGMIKKKLIISPMKEIPNISSLNCNNNRPNNNNNDNTMAWVLIIRFNLPLGTTICLGSLIESANCSNISLSSGDTHYWALMHQCVTWDIYKKHWSTQEQSRFHEAYISLLLISWKTTPLRWKFCEPQVNHLLVVFLFIACWQPWSLYRHSLFATLTLMLANKLWRRL